MHGTLICIIHSLIHLLSVYCCCTRCVPGTELDSADAGMQAWIPHLPLGTCILLGLDADRCTEELADFHKSPKGQKKEGEPREVRGGCPFCKTDKETALRGEPMSRELKGRQEPVMRKREGGTFQID